MTNYTDQDYSSDESASESDASRTDASESDASHADASPTDAFRGPFLADPPQGGPSRSSSLQSIDWARHQARMIMLADLRTDVEDLRLGIVLSRYRARAERIVDAFKYAGAFSDEEIERRVRVLERRLMRGEPADATIFDCEPTSAEKDDEAENSDGRTTPTAPTFAEATPNLPTPTAPTSDEFDAYWAASTIPAFDEPAAYEVFPGPYVTTEADERTANMPTTDVRDFGDAPAVLPMTGDESSFPAVGPIGGIINEERFRELVRREMFIFEATLPDGVTVPAGLFEPNANETVTETREADVPDTTQAETSPNEATFTYWFVDHNGVDASYRLVSYDSHRVGGSAEDGPEPEDDEDWEKEVMEMGMEEDLRAMRTSLPAFLLEFTVFGFRTLARAVSIGMLAE